jgi:sugar O-acyltransferase (sialic acid O-acetyltransferase NeuD family)
VTRIAIVGSRDFAQQMAIHLARLPAIQIAGFIDDRRPPGDMTPGGPVLGPIADLAAGRVTGVDAVILGIGYRDLKARGAILESLLGRVPLWTYVHETCWVDPSAELGEGVILLPGCRIDLNVRIGAGTILNLGCVVCHDTEVAENCFLGPSVTLSGFSSVGRDSFLGAGTVVIDNVRVGSAVQTGAGAVVAEDLQEPGLYVGVPARLRTTT